MNRWLIVLLLSVMGLFLSSCATVKKMICDCQPPKIENSKPTKKSYYKAAKPVKKVNANEAKKSEPAVPGAAVSSTEVVVDEPPDIAEVMLEGEVYEAMDAFVFEGDEKGFSKFCNSEQVQCWVKDKKWPAKKKLNKKKLQKTPFMTGSKMGLRGEERVQIRWEFYKLK